jgi:predicted metal-dependent hydrolase
MENAGEGRGGDYRGEAKVHRRTSGCDPSELAATRAAGQFRDIGRGHRNGTRLDHSEEPAGIRPFAEADLPEADPIAAIGAAVKVRISARARRISLRIDEAERAVLMVLPVGMPLRRGLRFLAEQRGWIATRLAGLPQRVPFVEGAVVPVFGVPHRIRRAIDPAGLSVAVACGEIRVRGDPADLPRRVRDHLIGAARAELTRRARNFAARIGHEVTRVGVRDPASRWGSCSSAGSLSFSWRLILAPTPVIDYVVAHEVAHLAEMNHGRHFWQLVESLAPGSTASRAWLKRHRSRLLSYG